VSKNPFTPLPPSATTPGLALEDAEVRIQNELDRKTKKPITFAEDGWDALEDASADHMGSVGVLAVQYARSEGHPQVHKKHVDDAHEFLGSRPRATRSIFITSSLGCLIGGIGGSTVGSIVATDSSRTVNDPVFLFWLGVAFVGFLLVVVSVAITMVSRRR
jgi:hypothetical protein